MAKKGNSYFMSMYILVLCLLVRHFDDISDYWLGGSDRAFEGKWVWVSSSQPITTYSNWYIGEPNNYQNKEHCLFANGVTKGWHDRSCEWKYQFICEGDYVEPIDETITIETDSTATTGIDLMSTSGVLTPSTNDDYTTIVTEIATTTDIDSMSTSGVLTPSTNDDYTTIVTDIATTTVIDPILTSGVVTPSRNESDPVGVTGIPTPQVTSTNANDSTGNQTLTGQNGSSQQGPSTLIATSESNMSSVHEEPSTQGGTSDPTTTIETHYTSVYQKTSSEAATLVSNNANTAATLVNDQNTQSQTPEDVIGSDSASTSLPVTVTRNDELTGQSPSIGTSQFVCAFNSSDCCSLMETFEDIKRLILEHRRLLLINKTETSKFQRTLKSAVDNRPSATGLGYIGGMLLAGIAVIVLSIDAINLLPLLRKFCRMDSRVHDSTLA